MKDRNFLFAAIIILSTMSIILGVVTHIETLNQRKRIETLIDRAVTEGYNAGRHDVVKRWYNKCRSRYGTPPPDPPGTKTLATYCGSEMEDLLGVENVWPGEFP